VTAAALPELRDSLSADEARVLQIMHADGYAVAEARTGWSRGRIWALAVRVGARKTEARIRERAAERRVRQAEYLASIVNCTTTADALDFLEGIPDDSIATTVTSIPYNLGVKYGDSPSADAMRFTYYRGFCCQIISELSRVTRPGGVVFLQVGQTRDWTNTLYPLDVMLFEDLRQSGLVYQSRVVWEIPHGLTPTRRLAERYETALVFSKGEPVFNPGSARGQQKQPGKRAFKGPRRGELSGTPLGAWPTNVWRIPNVGHNHPERALGSHPAQMPVALAKRAIVLYSMPGDVILDPFAGSGSTAVAALESGRAFVGADLFYADLRRNRLAAARPDTRSVLTGVTDESVAVWQAEARRVDVPASPSYDPAMDAQIALDMA
jgi:DNA modification methylase